MVVGYRKRRPLLVVVGMMEVGMGVGGCFGEGDDTALGIVGAAWTVVVVTVMVVAVMMMEDRRGPVAVVVFVGEPSQASCWSKSTRQRSIPTCRRRSILRLKE